MEYIVLGNFRGGTTLITKLLINAGVYMGDRMDTDLEDKDFQMQDIETIKRMIEKRNAEHDVWGWKFPGVYRYIEELLPYLKNPRFIFIFRDPLAVARTEQKWGHQFNLQTGNEANRKLIDLYYKLSPKIAFSYESFWKKPDETIDEFINFVGGDKKILKKCITQTYGVQ